MSDFVFILIIFLSVFLGVAISIFYIKKETKRLSQEQNQKKDDLLPLNLLKQDIENLRRKFENGYSQMTYQLGQIQEIGRGIKEFQNFFHSPKLRGNIGEEVLKELLEQFLPSQNFFLQYQFKGGQIVDAIIKTNQGFIPIDCKFPIENFRRLIEAETEEVSNIYRRDFIRDIKKYIDQIAKKYILIDEGTVGFALMYIPSEKIYYEIAHNQPEILEYGYNKKVYFTSPASFYYFLKIILIGLQGLKIEEGAKKILTGLKATQQEALKFEEELSILISHIERTKNASDRTRARFFKLLGKIEQLNELESSAVINKTSTTQNNPESKIQG